MKKTMNKIIKLLTIGIALSLVIVITTSCDNTRGSTPMLKVKASISWGLFPGSTDFYYIVYENGAVKKTLKFVPAKNGSYNYSTNDIDGDSDVLNIIDNNTPQAKELNKIAKDILLFKNDPKLEIVSVDWLYVFTDRYFFEALCNKDKRNSTLFEYFPADHTAKKNVSFNEKTINHVELYQP